MTNVLVLGASGQIARWAIEDLADDNNVQMTLFARNPARLKQAPSNARVVKGDVMDAAQLDQAMGGQDIVYANLTGDDIDHQAAAIIQAMDKASIQRLLFVTSLGLYDELPQKFQEWNKREIGAYLPPFRRAADLIEASGLDYTVLRPAWLDDNDDVDYETTEKGHQFKGTVVSRKAVGNLIARIIRKPGLHSRANIGVNKPGTDADKPYFM